MSESSACRLRSATFCLLLSATIRKAQPIAWAEPSSWLWVQSAHPHHCLLSTCLHPLHYAGSFAPGISLNCGSTDLDLWFLFWLQLADALHRAATAEQKIAASAADLDRTRRLLRTGLAAQQDLVQQKNEQRNLLTFKVSATALPRST